ncbi:MAG: LCP family protein [Alicyclobacillaceae bacterium]|nr:LCP family protein [Alicyclobacillaceae bacterium]
MTPRSQRIRVTLALLIVLSAAVAAYAGVRHSLQAGAGKAGGSKQVVTSALQGIGQFIAEDRRPVNILLIGNNARGAKDPLSLGTAAGQADILIVAHIDPAKHQVVLISVPRDTLIAMPEWRVPIPKIKTTFTLGLQEAPEKGPALAMQYVSKLTGLPIHDYIVTHFQGFVDAVDAVGGIRVYIPARLYDPYYSGVNLKPGWQTLNGQQALAFIRVRQNQAGNGYRVNDFQRQQAEMQVLQILKRKLLDSATEPAQLVKLVQLWRKDVATNLSTAELAGLGMQCSGAAVKTITLGSDRDSMNLASAPLPGINQENYLTGAYYDVLDPAYIAKVLKPYGSAGSDLGLPPLPKPQDVPVTVYGSAAVADKLRKAGFPVTYMGARPVARDAVYYPSGRMPWGWAVARVLGTSNEWVAPGASDRVVVYAP